MENGQEEKNDLEPTPHSMYGFGLTVDNVNEALPLGLDMVRRYGVPVTSRGMPTLEVPGPVTTIYKTPQRRVLFDPVRDCNHFFHLIEALWILAGSNRPALPCLFLKSYEQFAERDRSGKAGWYHGAYGHRLRRHFGAFENIDQLQRVIKLLKDKPDTRQAVLSIWDPDMDLGKAARDIPCNDMIMLRLRDNGELDMTVCNRSNDVIWGAYGANVVHFSMVQEFIAAAVGANVGRYVQMSNSYHVYTDGSHSPFWDAFLQGRHSAGQVSNPYHSEDIQPWPMVTSPQEADWFLQDCENLEREATRLVGVHETQSRALQLLSLLRFHTLFFQCVVAPAIKTFHLYKLGEFQEAMDVAHTIAAADWAVAMKDWVWRRWQKAQQSRSAR